MKVTILGSGSPISHPDRAGTGIAVEVGSDTLLIDCGPNVMYRILESDLTVPDIEWLFFTHHHLDHNADFYHLGVRTWMMGRQSLTVYGPPGTDELVDSFAGVYEQDFLYRKSLTDRPVTGVLDIDTNQVSEGVLVETDEWRISALPVEHSIETYAYRIDEFGTGASFVFSGDTKKLPRLAEFATDVDLLVHDCAIGPMAGIPQDDPLRHRYEDYFPMSDEMISGLHAVHADAAECAEVAEAAGADRLVLTHILLYRDEDQMRQTAADRFSGDVYMAEDGLVFTIPE